MTYCPWRLAPQDEDAARRLAAETGMPQLVCGVLAARGYGAPEKALALCGPGGPLGDPMRLSGMPQAVVEQLRGGPRADAVQGLEAGEADVLALTDAMTRDIEVPDALFAPLRSRYNDQELVELAATVAAYNMVSRFLVALRVGH